MKNFMKVEGLNRVIAGGAVILALSSMVIKSNEDSKAVMEKLNSLNDQVREQQQVEDQLKEGIQQAQDKMDELDKKQGIIDQQIKDKLSYREKISSAIQQTSGYVNKDKADKLAGIVDSVTTEFHDKYGFPKDDARLLAIMNTESSFRNLSANEADAVGYAQVTPACLSDVNKRTGWGYTMDDMSDAKHNLEVSWYFFNKDKVKYGDDKAIVAYNQGYRNLGGAVQASRGDNGSYLSKITDRTYKYQEMIGDVK